MIRFEQVVLPHLDAAHNLARWITGNDADADDVVQESFARALRFFEGFHSGDGRSWLLTIVRNTCYTWLKKNRGEHEAAPLDEETPLAASSADDPQALVARAADVQLVREALEQLPVPLREVLVLHELEGLAYKQIAEVAGIPIGTVMSRLARARQRLHACLTSRMKGGSP